MYIRISISTHGIQILSARAKVTEMSGNIYCLNLSAAFIVQVPSFRAVLEKARLIGAWSW